MPQCTTGSHAEYSTNKQIIVPATSINKRGLPSYQKRYSNSILDDQVMKNKVNSSYFNYCRVKNHRMVQSKMWATTSDTNTKSLQINASPQTVNQPYRRTQSNSIFELCSCLSTSSISSTNSSS